MSKLIKEEQKYIGPRFNVVQRIYEDDEKKQYIRDCVQTKDAVVVLAITENSEVIFVNQLREVIGEETLELPAGLIEQNELPINTAIRELEEETGYIANSIEPLIDVFSSCGYTDEKVYIFVAKDLVQGKQNFDVDEKITNVAKMPIEECLQLAKQNYFKHASQNIAILQYYFKYIEEK